jgi:hypothetical protein
MIKGLIFQMQAFSIGNMQWAISNDELQTVLAIACCPLPVVYCELSSNFLIFLSNLTKYNISPSKMVTITAITT